MNLSHFHFLISVCLIFRLSLSKSLNPENGMERVCGVHPEIEVVRIFRKDDGIFPNNESYPLILMKNAFSGRTEEEGRHLITKSGEWTNPWTWGVFEYHHYHSKAWELLLCVQREANVQLGGVTGPTIQMKQGDLVYVPPGFAHKQASSSNGFTLLGSYAKQGLEGNFVDTLTGPPTRSERAAIVKAFTPRCPLFGISLKDCSSRVL
jgi:uncharacterized protein YjlB